MTDEDAPSGETVTGATSPWSRTAWRLGGFATLSASLVFDALFAQSAYRVLTSSIPLSPYIWIFFGAGTRQLIVSVVIVFNLVLFCLAAVVSETWRSYRRGEGGRRLWSLGTAISLLTFELALVFLWGGLVQGHVLGALGSGAFDRLLIACVTATVAGGTVVVLARRRHVSNSVNPTPDTAGALRRVVRANLILLAVLIAAPLGLLSASHIGTWAFADVAIVLGVSLFFSTYFFGVYLAHKESAPGLTMLWV